MNKTIKNIILLIFTALIMVGCEYKSEAEIEEAERLNGFNTVVIDSCEYLIMSKSAVQAGYGYFSHKGNCRFCKERRQKELEEQLRNL
jgi:hypothetical protein